MNKIYKDDSWIVIQHKLYREGKSAQQIAREGGCSRHTIYNRFRSLQLKIRPPASRGHGGRPFLDSVENPVETAMIGLLASQWQYVDSIAKNAKKRSAAVRQIVDDHRAQRQEK